MRVSRCRCLAPVLHTSSLYPALVLPTVTGEQTAGSIEQYISGEKAQLVSVNSTNTKMLEKSVAGRWHQRRPCRTGGAANDREFIYNLIFIVVLVP